MQKIVLASGNKGKVREFNQLLAGSGFEVIPQTELGVEEVERRDSHLSRMQFSRHALQLSRQACRR